MGHLTKCEWGAVPASLSEAKGCLAVDVQEYATAQDMMQSTCLKAGYAHTLGFYEVGDGGAAYYTITDQGEPNGMDVLRADNKYICTLIVPNTITPEMVGAKPDGSLDCTANFQRALDICESVYVPNTYLFSTIEIHNGNHLFGDNVKEGVAGSLLISTAQSGYAITANDKTAHYTIENLQLKANSQSNNCGGIRLVNPYDNCIIRNLRIEDFNQYQIDCGLWDASEISQSLLIDNCVVYTNASIKTAVARFTRVYEMNIVNTKFLNRAVLDYPNVDLIFCWDVNIQGSSFTQTTVGAIRATKSMRYSRFIANTFENCAYMADIADATEKTDDYVSNIFIGTNYYNTTDQIKFNKDNGCAFNIFIGCYPIGGTTNLVLYPRGELAEASTQNVLGSMEGQTFLQYFGQNFGITYNYATHHAYSLYDNSSASADYGLDLIKRFPDGTSKTLVRIDNNVMNMSVNSDTKASTLILKGEDGNNYYVFVNSSGNLVASKV